MLHTDFDTRPQLAREHRDELERAIRLARLPRPEATRPGLVRSVLARAYDRIRSRTRLEESYPRLPQES